MNVSGYGSRTRKMIYMLPFREGSIGLSGASRNYMISIEMISDLTLQYFAFAFAAVEALERGSRC